MGTNNKIEEFDVSNALTADHLNEIVKKINILADIKDIKIETSKPVTPENDVLYFITETE